MTLQVEILRSLLPNRNRDSVVAGGSVLHRHAFRLSDDHDFFHPDGRDMRPIAEKDIELLRANDFEVEITSRDEGMVEAIVYAQGRHPTKLQWVLSGLWNFYGAVPDDLFGWRLHMVDIAINKVLAAASRHEPRDYVDLALIHAHILPLWHAIWAAPGKDPSFNPGSLIDRMSRNNHFSQKQLEAAVDSLAELDATELVFKVRQALDEAETIIRRLPPKLAGNLFVDGSGNPLENVDGILNGLADQTVRPIGAVENGARPSSPDIDRAIIDRMIDRYGPEGSAADSRPVL